MAFNESGVEATINIGLVHDGNEAIHMTAAIIFAVIFLGISIFTVGLCFERRINFSSYLARRNACREIYDLLGKTTILVIYETIDQNWIVISVLLFYALVLTHATFFRTSYYDQAIRKSLKITTALFLWSCLVLFLLELVSSMSFQGGFIVWGCGVPFIAFSISGDFPSPENVSAGCQLKTASSQSVVNSISNLLLIIKNSNLSKKAKIELWKYISEHLELCTEKFCPLRTTKLSGVDTHQSLLLTIKKLFIIGMHKFKASVDLKLLFVEFLCDNMHHFKTAHEQICDLESFQISWSQQFRVSHMAKFINVKLGMEMNNSALADGSTLSGRLRLQNRIDKFTKLTFSLISAHKDLWTAVLGNKESLDSFSFRTFNFDKDMAKIRKKWKRIDPFKFRYPNIIRLYAKILKYTANRSIKAAEMEAVFQSAIVKTHYHQSKDFSELEKVKNNSALVMTKYDKTTSQFVISFANKALCSFLGYNKEGIENKPLKHLFPRLYSQSIKGFLFSLLIAEEKEQYNAPENRLSNSYFSLHSTGSVLPIRSHLKHFYSADVTDEENPLIISIDGATTFNAKAIALINIKGYITDLNCTGFFNLGLRQSQFNDFSFKIQDLIPDILVNSIYRQQSIYIEFNNYANVEMAGNFELKPLLFKAQADDSESPKRILEENSLIGFALYFDAKRINGSCLERKSLKITFDEPELKGRDIWSELLQDSQLRCPRGSSFNRRGTIHLTNPDLRAQMGIEPDFAEDIITKRLVKGRLIDFFHKEYNDSDCEIDFASMIQNNSSKIIKAVSKEHSEGLSKMITKGQYLLEKLIAKEKRHTHFFRSNIYLLIWLIGMIASASIIWKMSFEKKDYIWSKIYLGRQIISNMANVAAVSIKINEIRMATILPNSSREFIAQKFNEIEKLTAIIVVNSSLSSKGADLKSVFKSFSNNYYMPLDSSEKLIGQIKRRLSALLAVTETENRHHTLAPLNSQSILLKEKKIQSDSTFTFSPSHDDYSNPILSNIADHLKENPLDELYSFKQRLKKRTRKLTSFESRSKAKRWGDEALQSSKKRMLFSLSSYPLQAPLLKSLPNFFNDTATVCSIGLRELRDIRPASVSAELFVVWSKRVL